MQRLLRLVLTIRHFAPPSPEDPTRYAGYGWYAMAKQT